MSETPEVTTVEDPDKIAKVIISVAAWIVFSIALDGLFWEVGQMSRGHFDRSWAMVFIRGFALFYWWKFK